MKEKGLGQALIIFLLLMGIIMAPGIILAISPTAKLIFSIIIVLMVVGFVQSYLGPGKLTWLITIILIVIALRNVELFSGVYTLYMIIGTGVSSFLIFIIAPAFGKFFIKPKGPG